MNDDTFSRNEARMVQFHSSNDRVTSRESANGFANVIGARLANDAASEDAQRVAEQVAQMNSVGPIAALSGVSVREATEAFALALASKKRSDRIVDFYTMDDAIDIANAIRESGLSEITVIADLVRLNNRHERELAALRSEIADLRAALPAAPTGAHPYRSTATKAPSSPVAASGAPERVDGRPGALRRVYGALASLCRHPGFGLGAFVGSAGVALAGAAMVDPLLCFCGMAAFVVAAVRFEFSCAGAR